MIVSVIHTSISLAIIYSSYLISIEYLTLLYSDLGLISYVLIFTMNVIFSIIMPFLIFNIINVKTALIIGGIGYIIWTIMFNLKIKSLLIIGSILVGITSAFFRTQQNVWIVSLKMDINKKDYYVGTYNTIFNFSGIIAASFALIIFILGYNIEILLWITIIVSTGALISLLFIKSVEIDESFKTNIMDLIKYNFKIETLLIIPYILLQASNLSFTYEILPLMIKDEFKTSIMYLIYSITFSINTYVFGIIIKRVNLIFILPFTIIFNLINLVLFIAYSLYEFNNTWFIVLGFVAGIIDSILNSSIIYIYYTYFQSKVIYSLHRSYICIFSAIFSISVLYISIINIMFMICIINLISILLYIALIYIIDIKKYNINNEQIV